MRISWPELEQNILECRACPLCGGCRRKVPGQGDPHAPLMLIGEGPGEQEDRQGLAFVGPAGQLLTKMLDAIQLPRERVYICNIVKCRPPGNRTPTVEEAAACEPHLLAQWALVKPKAVLLLGSTAVRSVLGANYRITRCRGQWFERRGVPVAYLLGHWGFWNLDLRVTTATLIPRPETELLVEAERRLSRQAAGLDPFEEEI